MKKELYIDYFRDKKITVMGLGILGRGVGDTDFMAKNEAELIVTDKKSESDLAASLALLKQYPTITYVLGEHTMSSFEGRDSILKAAGVPSDSEYIAHAKKQKIPVYMSAALVSRIVSKHLEGVTIIGVTGTRGKTTVTQLIAYILRSSGLTVHIGGNVRGVANLPLLDVIEDGDFLVLELDSWQLQGFGDMEISPHISVFTSFMDDHMNYYHGDRERYFSDKAHIYEHQTKYDVLIASTQAEEEIRKRNKKCSVTVPEKRHLVMKLIGEHNLVAANLAYEAALQCGVSNEDIEKAIALFPGVEGRLQDLGMVGKNQIRVLNDNNATTADATIAAIEAVIDTYRKKPIVILGGADKGLPLTKLEEMLLIMVKEVIFLEGTGTDKINLPKKYQYATLSECLTKAMSLAEGDDVVLFSPGFASFSKEFNNEYERNDAFLQLVKNIV